MHLNQSESDYTKINNQASNNEIQYPQFNNYGVPHHVPADPQAVNNGYGQGFNQGPFPNNQYQQPYQPYQQPYPQQPYGQGGRPPFQANDGLIYLNKIRVMCIFVIVANLFFDIYALIIFNWISSLLLTVEFIISIVYLCQYGKRQTATEKSFLKVYKVFKIFAIIWPIYLVLQVIAFYIIYEQNVPDYMPPFPWDALIIVYSVSFFSFILPRFIILSKFNPNKLDRRLLHQPVY